MGSVSVNVVMRHHYCGPPNTCLVFLCMIISSHWEMTSSMRGVTLKRDPGWVVGGRVVNYLKFPNSCSTLHSSMVLKILKLPARTDIFY